MAGSNQNNKPERVYAIGFCAASVWKRQFDKDGRRFTRRSVSIQKSYLDSEGEKKYTTSFDLSELPQAIRAMQLAQGYIESCEAQRLE